jgi:GNAT superfamily N-acetyltransferase
MLADREASPGSISFEEIFFYDLSPFLFDRFNRHQEVNFCWRKKAGKWFLLKAPSTLEWSKADIASLMDGLTYTLRSGGIMLGAFINHYLAGFASIEYDSFGPDYEYILLSNLYVSYGHRRKGIGRMLFTMACSTAKKMGARKLYISAHSAEETQAFFKAMKCVEAAYCHMDLIASNPFDCQLECVL